MHKLCDETVQTKLRKTKQAERDRNYNTQTEEAREDKMNVISSKDQ